MQKLNRLVTPAAVLAAILLFLTIPARAQLDYQALDPLAGDDDAKVKVSAQFTAPAGDQPSRLFIQADIQEGWHIYSITQPPGGPVRTQIKLPASDQYKLAGEFTPIPAPDKKPEPAFDNLITETHHGTVVWYAPITLAEGVDLQKLKISGQLFAQRCDADNCLPPQNFPFTAALGPGVPIPKEEPAEKPAEKTASMVPPQPVPPQPVPPQTATQELKTPPLPASSQPPAAVAKHNDQIAWRPFTSIATLEELVGDQFDADAAAPATASVFTLLVQLGVAFLGGLILNVMPCVLPVIGLKVLSFVEQSGHDRRKAFTLNAWYSAGLLSVFLLLAFLSVVMGLGWGQLFSYKAFNIALVAVVFVMGLSFLGVWEVPIPGFVGGNGVNELAKKEGPQGAFAKGVLTTILATPCSAPFLASALVWTATQPPLFTFAVFTAAGLGMASPYLLIGAYPQLLRFLPKPGAWMDTFKQIMGFVLMGTVVYILTFLDWTYVVPTVGLLFGLWGACWWIGRISPTADTAAKTRAWLAAAAFAGVIWVFMFPGLKQVAPKPLNIAGLHGVMEGRFEEKVDLKVAKYLEEQRKQGKHLMLVSGEVSAAGPKTVMVDFTADWCPTCKSLEAGVLNTPAVIEALDTNGIVPIKADWTDGQPEVTEMLHRLGSKQIPVLLIIPAGNWEDRIVLRGGYFPSTVLKAFNEALSKARPASKDALAGM